MSVTTLKLKIKMLSDWRVGSGTGRQGALDDLVQRDGEDLPYIPQSTLKGILRDQAETLAYALDAEDGKGDWAGLVDQLFGSQPNLVRSGEPISAPLKSLIHLSPARLSETVRKELSGGNRAELRDLLTFAKAGVAIDDKTGTASNDMLRFLEMSRKGMILEASMDIDLPDDASGRDTAVEFLQCAAALVTSIGGDRRRGAGKCEVGVEGGSKDTRVAAASLAKAQPPAHLQTSAANDTAGATLPGTMQSRSFVRLDLTVNLDSPTIIASDVIGNTITTRDYLPGTLLLGPAKKMLAQYGLANKECDEAILGGRIRVLPGYLEMNGTRSMPVPFCWAIKKDDAGAAGKAAIVNKLCQKIEGQTKGMKSGYFVRPGRKYPQIARPEIRVFTHNTVNDDWQAPSSDVGGVYVYEALAEGQSFRTELWIEESLAKEMGLESRTSTETVQKAAIGRATAAGYGQIELSLGEVIVDNLEQQPGLDTLYFETDCILPDGVAPEAFLQEIAGQELSDDEQYLRYSRLDRWNARRGLPRRSVALISAGSVAVFESAISQKRLAEMKAAFAGTRPAEGFGRIRSGFSPVMDEIDASMAEADEPASQAEANSPATEFNQSGDAFLAKVADQFVKSLILRLAEEAVGKGLARKLFGDNPENITLSTLGSIRSVMGQLEDEQRLENLQEFLKSRLDDGKTEPFKSLNKHMKWETLDELLGVQKELERALGNSTAAKFITDKNKLFAFLCAFHAAVRSLKRNKEREVA